MDTLTQQEQQTLEQFVSITNYPLDPSTAIHYLHASDWNIERAIIAYYEATPQANQQLNNNARRTVFPGSFPDADGQYRSSVGVQQQQRNSQNSTEPGFFQRLSNRTQALFHGGNNYMPLSTNSSNGFVTLGTESKVFYASQVILYLPIFLSYKTTEILFSILSKVFPILRRLTTRYSQNRNSSKSQPKGIEPSQIARNFISDFNTYYRNDNRIDFFEGGYTAALYLAKRDARFLVVYLHSDEHDDTSEFVTKTLLHPNTLKFFKDQNILIWAGCVHESEAYQVANALNATKFPYLGLLGLKSNTQETPEGTSTLAPTLTCVSRVQGLVTPAKLIEKFSAQIEKLEPMLVTLRAERQQQEIARVIREQQDQAYQASLERDRMISDQRRQKALIEQKKQQYLKWRLSTLLPVDNSLKGDYARVAIRLSNGERISRNFDKNAKLEEIYAFTELHQKQMLNEPVSNAERPENFVYPYQFKLISPMPRAEIVPSLDIYIKDEPSIWPNGNLIVEDIENE